MLAHGATAKITKQIPTRLEILWPAGSGTRQAVFDGVDIVESPIRAYRTTLFSVDLVSGSIERIISRMPGMSDFTCFGDQADLIVCNGSQDLRSVEILGIADKTGKKLWGYTERQRVAPRVTAAFHGVVYAQSGGQPVLLEAASGRAIPAATRSPSGATPAGDALSLYDNQMQSPTAVTPYGAIYLQDATGAASLDFEKVLVTLTPTG
ncbi:hypothetical protein [Kribbella swartbergensis]